MNLAEENAARVELMAAQFRHQAAACPLVKAPAHEFFHALVAELADLAFEGVAILLLDLLPPAVSNDDIARLWIDDDLAVFQLGLAVLSMPQGTDVADLAQQTRLQHFHGMSVEHAVVALVADGQDAIGLIGDLDHLLALADIPGHQLFAQDVLAGLHAIDGDGGMQVQRQGDNDGFDIFVLEQFLVVFVQLDVLARVFAVDAVEALAWPGQLALEDALLVGGANVGIGDDFEVLGVVLAHEHTALIAGADQGGLHRLVLDLLVLVAVVNRGGHGGGRTRSNEALHEITAGHARFLVFGSLVGELANRLMEVGLADFLL